MSLVRRHTRNNAGMESFYCRGNVPEEVPRGLETPLGSFTIAAMKRFR